MMFVMGVYRSLHAGLIYLFLSYQDCIIFVLFRLCAARPSYTARVLETNALFDARLYPRIHLFLLKNEKTTRTFYTSSLTSPSVVLNFAPARVLVSCAAAAFTVEPGSHRANRYRYERQNRDQGRLAFQFCGFTFTAISKVRTSFGKSAS